MSSNSSEIKYQLRFGTTSEFIPPQHRPTLKDANTHKWRLYLRGPPNAPDPSFIVKSCRIILDESYAPGHDITLTSYPFHLSRRGFSGFDIQVEIHLWGSEDRAISFKHALTLTNETDRECVEQETQIELMLRKEEILDTDNEIINGKHGDQSGNAKQDEKHENTDLDKKQTNQIDAKEKATTASTGRTTRTIKTRNQLREKVKEQDAMQIDTDDKKNEENNNNINKNNLKESNDIEDDIEDLEENIEDDLEDDLEDIEEDLEGDAEVVEEEEIQDVPMKDISIVKKGQKRKFSEINDSTTSEQPSQKRIGLRGKSQRKK